MKFLYFLIYKIVIIVGFKLKQKNEAVKNNPDKFPERFSWKLTDVEFFDL